MPPTGTASPARSGHEQWFSGWPVERVSAPGVRQPGRPRWKPFPALVCRLHCPYASGFAPRDVVMRKLSARFLLLLLAALLLAACHKGEQEKLVEEGATPQAAMESAIRDIRHGDFDQLRRNLLPPAAYQDLRDAWDAGRHREQADVTAQERQQFA